MAVPVMMPRQGQSVESCIITTWHKKVGDPVKVGDLLFTYETDKATFDEEAKEDGVLLAILIDEGDDVPVLENVAFIGEKGEDISDLVKGAPAPEAPKPAPEAPKPAPEAPKPPAPGVILAPPAPGLPVDGRVKISPRAKNLAENQGLDISQAVPTGPEGRIIERDIIELSKRPDAAAPAPKPAAPAPPVPVSEYEDIPLSQVRKVIAKSMHASLSEMAQLTHNSSFDATDILAFRKRVKASAENLGLSNITLNDIVLYAVSRVIKNYPDLNAHFLGDKIRRFNSVNLGMAVDTPRGLLVPTIFNADKMSLNEISSKAKELAKAAQEGKISPDLLTGASFTISNLGSFGIESFTPVVNPPQTGILGVCNIQTKLKMDGDDPVAYQAMGLSLTYDHRALDGAPASKFLAELCRSLENFTVLLAK